MEKETCRLKVLLWYTKVVEPNFSKKIANIFPKSICLWGEIHLLACLPAWVLTLCQLRNFLCEFTEKCFAIFDQSSLTIYLTWYWSLLFFQGFPSIMHSFYDFKVLVKSRGGGTFLCLALLMFSRSNFFFIW